METRILGSTGPAVSALGLGAMGMSEAYGAADRAGSIATVHAVLVCNANTALPPFEPLATLPWSVFIAEVAGELSGCTASEPVAVVLTWGLGRWQGWGRIAGCVYASAVSDHGSGLRLVGAAGAWPGVEGRGDHGFAA
jgi:hypothetical protein